MNQHFETIYFALQNILGIILGFIFIFFHRKIIEANKRFASRRKGLFFRRMADQPYIQAKIIAIIVGGGTIIISTIKLFRLLVNAN
jgi:hypothetical protein